MTGRVAKAVKAVVAAAMVAATALAALSFVLYRAGRETEAATLLAEHHTAALVALTVLLAPLLHRLFDR